MTLVTSSLRQEFYNVFLKTPDSLPFKVEITNVPEDINTILESVSRTQTRAKTIPANTPVLTFQTADELISYLSSASIG